MAGIEDAPLQSRPDEINRVERVPPMLPRKLLAGAIGTLLTGASIAVDMESRSGNYVMHAPTVETVQEEYHAAPADSAEHFESGGESQRLVAISWNKWEGKFRPAGVRSMIQEFNPDVIAMQETTPQLAKWYAKQFPDWWVIFVEASRNPKRVQGQTMMLRHEPTDINTLSMEGSSWHETAGHATMGNLRFVEARRAAVAITFDKGDEEYTVSNTHLSHITDGSVHRNQTRKYIDWTIENNVHVSLGDYNDEYDGMIASHADTSYVVPEITGPTLVSGDTIDFCVYDPKTVELTSARALPEPVTDHYPIVCEFVKLGSEKPAEDLSTLPKGYLFSVKDEPARG